MPTYEFKNKDTDEVFEKIMSYDDKVKFLEENPNIQSYYSTFIEQGEVHFYVFYKRYKI